MMKRIVTLTMAAVVLAGPTLPEEPEVQHLIRNVTYQPMLDGYCAMTCLRMVLAHHGVGIDQSLLLNLGWNYGFFFVESPWYLCAWPCSDPPHEVAHVSKLLGFKAAVITHSSLEEAKGSLVKHLARGVPVIVQWTPHTVVAFGCEQGGDTILIHDPGDPQPKLRTKPSSAVIGRGEAQRVRIADWEKPPYLWQHRQFQMVVVEPADKEPRIDWKKVWKRNALKTLGTDDGAFQDYSGVRGMRKLAGAIRNRFGHSEDKQFRKTLLNFYGTFQIGVGFRRNASAFLAGHAAALGDESLMGAARCFRKSAHEFRKGENLLKLLRRDPEKLVEVQNETAEILLRIAGIEEKAAGLLLQVAKK